MNNNTTTKKRLITEQELIEQTTDKYRLRYWQDKGFFTTVSQGMFDARWVTVWEESRQYMRAGFAEWAALCEAMKDVFGYLPDEY